MKSSWRIWTGFCVCLAIGIVAMVWLTRETVKLEKLRRLDRAEIEQARRETELQERISSVLWRMDWLLTPLIAQEASRSVHDYRSFQSTPGSRISVVRPSQTGDSANSGIEGVTPSPLLAQPSEFVLVHFQIDDQGGITSPQVPEGNSKEQAIACGVSPDAVSVSTTRLAELATTCSFETVLDNCPAERLPAMSLPNAPWQQSQAVEKFVKQNLDANRQVVQQPNQQEQLGQFQSDTINSNSSVPLQSGNPIISEQRQRNQQRASQELGNRTKATQTYALNEFANTLLDSASIDTAVTGVMRPFWSNGNLLLARRVDLPGATIVQGCWLDWPKIKARLELELEDVLHHAELRPIANDSVPQTGRILATLPVELVVADAQVDNLMLASIAPSRWSGSQLALFAAWVGLILASVAAAVMLAGVLRLSARRAAFVSAVSHELRSPLTTFQLYSDMLADNLVDGERRNEYAQTLRAESVRLGTLVDNVLQYSRLENGAKRQKIIEISVGELLQPIIQRLRDRAQQAEMQVDVEVDAKLAKRLIRTDPAGVERVLYNLVDNACKYARNSSDRRIELKARQLGNRLALTVSDGGPGIERSQQKQLFQAFSKSDQEAANSAPGVGLGLALSRRISSSLGGRLFLQPSDRGASFVLELPL